VTALTDRLDDEGVSEHEVVWFPDDVPERRVRTLDEKLAQRTYDREREAGTMPILSSRWVTATPWHVDANARLA
jgi:hypothetical protein